MARGDTQGSALAVERSLFGPQGRRWIERKLPNVATNIAFIAVSTIGVCVLVDHIRCDINTLGYWDYMQIAKHVFTAVAIHTVARALRRHIERMLRRSFQIDDEDRSDSAESDTSDDVEALSRDVHAERSQSVEMALGQQTGTATVRTEAAIAGGDAARDAEVIDPATATATTAATVMAAGATEATGDLLPHKEKGRFFSRSTTRLGQKKGRKKALADFFLGSGRKGARHEGQSEAAVLLPWASEQGGTKKDRSDSTESYTSDGVEVLSRDDHMERAQSVEMALGQQTGMATVRTEAAVAGGDAARDADYIDPSTATATAAATVMAAGATEAMGDLLPHKEKGRIFSRSTTRHGQKKGRKKALADFFLGSGRKGARAEGQSEAAVLLPWASEQGGTKKERQPSAGTFFTEADMDELLQSGNFLMKMCDDESWLCVEDRPHEPEMNWLLPFRRGYKIIPRFQDQVKQNEAQRMLFQCEKGKHMDHVRIRSRATNSLLFFLGIKQPLTWVAWDRGVAGGEWEDLKLEWLQSPPGHESPLLGDERGRVIIHSRSLKAYVWWNGSHFTYVANRELATVFMFQRVAPRPGLRAVGIVEARATPKERLRGEASCTRKFGACGVGKCRLTPSYTPSSTLCPRSQGEGAGSSLADEARKRTSSMTGGGWPWSSIRTISKALTSISQRVQKCSKKGRLPRMANFFTEADMDELVQSSNFLMKMCDDESWLCVEDRLHESEMNWLLPFRRGYKIVPRFQGQVKQKEAHRMLFQCEKGKHTDHVRIRSRATNTLLFFLGTKPVLTWVAWDRGVAGGEWEDLKLEWLQSPPGRESPLLGDERGRVIIHSRSLKAYVLWNGSHFTHVANRELATVFMFQRVAPRPGPGPSASSRPEQRRKGG